MFDFRMPTCAQYLGNGIVDDIGRIFNCGRLGDALSRCVTVLAHTIEIYGLFKQRKMDSLAMNVSATLCT